MAAGTSSQPVRLATDWLSSHASKPFIHLHGQEAGGEHAVGLCTQAQSMWRRSSPAQAVRPASHRRVWPCTRCPPSHGPQGMAALLRC
jgi:hypothetical protein